MMQPKHSPESMAEKAQARYWLGVVSLSHVERGVAGNFAQLCHGKEAPLRRMKKGDWLVYYSPKTDMHDGRPLQAFTAIGKVTGNEVFSFEMSPDFVPYRRDVKFVNARQASIIPLLESLSFIKDPRHWGYPLRQGHFEISRGDFELIAKAMRAADDA